MARAQVCNFVPNTTPNNERPQCKFGRPQRGWGASVGGEQAVRAQIWRVTEAQSTDLLCGTNLPHPIVECQ